MQYGLMKKLRSAQSASGPADATRVLAGFRLRIAFLPRGGRDFAAGARAGKNSAAVAWADGERDEVDVEISSVDKATSLASV